MKSFSLRICLTLIVVAGGLAPSPLSQNAVASEETTEKPKPVPATAPESAPAPTPPPAAAAAPTPSLPEASPAPATSPGAAVPSPTPAPAPASPAPTPAPTSTPATSAPAPGSVPDPVPGSSPDGYTEPIGPVKQAPPMVAEGPPGKPAQRINLVPPAKGLYLGAYIDFGEKEDTVTLEKIQKFETMVGQHQAIIASSSYWGEQSFPSENVALIRRHGSVPLIFWSPWDRPYRQRPTTGPDRFALGAIVDGKHDAYIDAWADKAAASQEPLLVAWGIEMNGEWFPWSSFFYQKPHPGDPPNSPRRAVRSTPPVSDAESVELYKTAYRRVVDRCRARGAANILWVYCVNNGSYPPEPWNTMAAYYPGPDYVDWLAYNAYGAQFPDTDWLPAEGVFMPAYRELAALDPVKPIMLAEWGVGEFPRAGNKAAFIREAMERMRTQMPRLKAAVFWHERWQNESGYYSNLRVHSSPESLDAFKKEAARPEWITKPELKAAVPVSGAPKNPATTKP